MHAPPATLGAADARDRLPQLPEMVAEPALHLAVPVRSLRHEATPAWVDRVLAGDAAGARRLVEAHGPVPFRLTRDLASLRGALRVLARDRHRAGLVASAGARRLRAEGLGCELPHMDADAVARWFLDSWRRDRDVRASDALELVATQFSVQGLELDQVGLCWDGDLVREGPGGAWQARSFRGTRWEVARGRRQGRLAAERLPGAADARALRDRDLGAARRRGGSEPGPGRVRAGGGHPAVLRRAAVGRILTWGAVWPIPAA